MPEDFYKRSLATTRDAFTILKNGKVQFQKGQGTMLLKNGIAGTLIRVKKAF